MSRLRDASTRLATIALCLAIGSFHTEFGQTTSANDRWDESSTEDNSATAGELPTTAANASTDESRDECQSPEVAPRWYQVAFQSLVCPLHPDLWHPLSVDTLFSEGWDEQYTPAPHDTPHQTWINSADGGFYRLYVMSFAYAANVPGPNNSHATNTELFLFTPLNRRLEIGWFLPLVESTPSVTGQQANWGDLTVAPRLLLNEQKNFTTTANLFIRTPTGNAINGSSVTSFSPDIEAWWTEPEQHWVVRGALGVTLPIKYSGPKAELLAANPWTGFNASPGAFNSFDARLAIGKH
ncbi:MAG: hypothetical protein JSS02_29500 [Planctomycetes bacterium]|nr:hypothetical protein [Planctomycetota bacterium]